jgi:hypothetical protein
MVIDLQIEEEGIMKMDRHVPEERRRGVKGYGGKKWSRRQIIQGIVVLLVWVWAGLFLRGLGWTLGMGRDT